MVNIGNKLVIVSGKKCEAGPEIINREFIVSAKENKLLLSYNDQ